MLWHKAKNVVRFAGLAPHFRIVTTQKRTRTYSMGEASAPKRRSASPEQWTYGVAKNGNTMKINLTKIERDICDLLNNVSDYISSQRPELPRIEARIAGGWVRDKLLGDQCHDLDVAVNSMMGYEFATYINEYLKSVGAPTKGIAKIESNPAKSKHLETATTRLYGLEVDFANLRTEVYDENSRIPSQITFGTPKEDAYRRDITINSLFYNVDTRKVEDFTEKGLEDLQAGLIRTPLPPYETFKDDPLRVLRCVRFASRFSFELVDELAEAAKNPTISEALNSKISRERILTEVEKMITGPSPLKAVQLLYSLNLYNIVFQPPALVSGSIADPRRAVHAVGAAEWLIKHVADFQTTSSSDIRLIYYSACALPFLNGTSEQKGKQVPAVQIMLRDSLKAPNADVTNISTVFKGIPMFQQAANDNTSQPVSRSELGMIIRDMGARWESTLKVACIDELLQKLPSIAWDKPDEIDDAAAQEIVVKYVNLHKKAIEYDITKCYEWKYLINGKKVAELLGIKPGPILADILKTLMIWQLDHPNGTEEECTKMLKSYWQQKQRNQ